MLSDVLIMSTMHAGATRFVGVFSSKTLSKDAVIVAKRRRAHGWAHVMVSQGPPHGMQRSVAPQWQDFGGASVCFCTCNAAGHYWRLFRFRMVLSLEVLIWASPGANKRCAHLVCPTMSHHVILSYMMRDT